MLSIKKHNYRAKIKHIVEYCYNMFKRKQPQHQCFTYKGELIYLHPRDNHRVQYWCLFGGKELLLSNTRKHMRQMITERKENIS